MIRSRLIETVRRGGGVMRARTLHGLGASRHGIARAIAEGALVRPTRGWVAIPGADADLLAAARAGVVLTCVTQARRLGLWVLGDEGVHGGARPHGHHDSAFARVHWNEPVVPRHPDALTDPIENVLALAAFCQPHDHALAIWESALNKGLTSLEALRRLPLTGCARALVDEAVPWSDSGLESFVVPRLSWMRLPIVPQAWVHGHRVDFLIGDRLVLQIDGGHHVGLQRAEDVAHDADLVLRGYTVIRVTYVQVVERWHEVQARIMRAVAQGLHLAR